MSNYARGAAFERRVQSLMEQLGYCTIRSSGSHSPADIWCAKRDKPLLLIQCKISGYVGVHEWNEFYDFCNQAGARPIVAEKVRGGAVYREITGKKSGAHKAQPWEVITIE